MHEFVSLLFHSIDDYQYKTNSMALENDIIEA